MENRISPFLISILCIGIAVLYIPILVLIGYSFNASALVSVWGGFSTSWYTAAPAQRPDPRRGVAVSLKIGVVVSTGVGHPGHSRRDLPGALQDVSRPAAAHGNGQCAAGDAGNHHRHHAAAAVRLHAASVLGWPHRGFTTIVIAHIAFCSAYVTVTVQSRLASADRSLEEAAMDLGSGPVRAFIDTTLPGIAPALASSWLLSFTLSLDDLVISSFVSGPGASTLPMVIFSKVKLGVSPDVNALASLMICLVGVCVLLAGYLMRRAERQRVLDAQMAER